MKRRLFLTGPIGCGKSTAIQTALGDRLTACGGFLTRRYREPHLHFTLESPDGSKKEVFLDFSSGKPRLKVSVFSTFGKELLQPCRDDASIAPCVLDEIGGIELLNTDFASALDAVLKSDTPIIGVMKGEGPAGALIEALGLTREYEIAVSQLREKLHNDPDTLLYECKQYDENALLLAKQWTEEYLHD